MIAKQSVLPQSKIVSDHPPGGNEDGLERGQVAGSTGQRLIDISGRKPVKLAKTDICVFCTPSWDAAGLFVPASVGSIPSSRRHHRNLQLGRAFTKYSTRVRVVVYCKVR